MGLWDDEVVGSCGPWMYDTQVQGSAITILLTLFSRFSAVFGFLGVESLWH